MNLRTIPRAAVGGSIKAVRWPVERALSLRGGDAGPAVDRAEAAAREVAGTALADNELKADARARRTAADQREQAADLRDQAAATREAGRASAQQRKRAAKKRAATRKQTAEKQRTATKTRAADTERTRKAAAERDAARTEAAIDARARSERLEQLDERAALQEKQADALTAQDEARRLADSAARVKEERKAS